jgi:hypothetical protein
MRGVADEQSTARACQVQRDLDQIRRRLRLLDVVARRGTVAQRARAEQAEVALEVLRGGRAREDEAPAGQRGAGLL